MILESLASIIISCSSLVPGDPGVKESKYLLDQTAILSHGAVYRRWDLTLDGRADVMTVHLIDPTQLERYKQLLKEGVKFDVVFFKNPKFYWIDITGADSWDRIYIDENYDGKCRLYAQKEQPT